jgi:hypothetical protein
MVKSTPMRHQTIIRERRSGFGVIRFLFLLLVLIVGAVLVIGFVWPVRLAIVQERVLGLFHGGITSSEEQKAFDTCMMVDGFEEPQAISRIIRTTRFRDGTSLSVTFSEPPLSMNKPCTIEQAAP